MRKSFDVRLNQTFIVSLSLQMESCFMTSSHKVGSPGLGSGSSRVRVRVIQGKGSPGLGLSMVGSGHRPTSSYPLSVKLYSNLYNCAKHDKMGQRDRSYIKLDKKTLWSYIPSIGQPSGSGTPSPRQCRCF